MELADRPDLAPAKDREQRQRSEGGWVENLRGSGSYAEGSDMTINKRIDIELLKRIMIEVERRALTDHSGSPVMTNDDNFTDQDCPADSQIDHLNESTNAESVERRSRETEHLEILGKLLQWFEMTVEQISGAYMQGGTKSKEI